MLVQHSISHNSVILSLCSTVWCNQFLIPRTGQPYEHSGEMYVGWTALSTCKIFLFGFKGKKRCWWTVAHLTIQKVHYSLPLHRQLPLYNNEIRWQQPNPNPAGPYLAYPIISAQPPVSAEYTYYQLMPAPCAQVMGFYHPFPTPYSAPFQTTSAINTVTAECTDRPTQPNQVFSLCSQQSRSSNRGPAVQKVSPFSKQHN